MNVSLRSAVFRIEIPFTNGSKISTVARQTSIETLDEIIINATRLRRKNLLGLFFVKNPYNSIGIGGVIDLKNDLDCDIIKMCKNKLSKTEDVL